MTSACETTTLSFAGGVRAEKFTDLEQEIVFLLDGRNPWKTVVSFIG
jgi:hypothetical protein